MRKQTPKAYISPHQLYATINWPTLNSGATTVLAFPCSPYSIYFSYDEVYTLVPNNSSRASNRSAISHTINLIRPRSTFAIRTASFRLSILVKGLWCCSTGCTPATMLNCKHAVTSSRCSHGALFNGVLPTQIWSIQNRILSFQRPDCSVWGVLVTSNRC